MAVKITYFISGLDLPYECLFPLTLRQPMSGSLRAPRRSASTHSLSLFIAEYGQPNALQRPTQTTHFRTETRPFFTSMTNMTNTYKGSIIIIF